VSRRYLIEPANFDQAGLAFWFFHQCAVHA
jgi:hypothetical protein